MNGENDKQEILEAINALATHMDSRFEASEARLSKEIAETKHELRDYVDRRISDAVAEISGPVRSVDEKDSELVIMLEKKEIISQVEAQSIGALSPFASRT